MLYPIMTISIFCKKYFNKECLNSSYQIICLGGVDSDFGLIFRRVRSHWSLKEGNYMIKFSYFTRITLATMCREIKYIFIF